jgi:propanediol dehydratase small subunit
MEVKFMNQEKLIEQIVKEVMLSMTGEKKESDCKVGSVSNTNKATKEDYPLATNRPEWIKTLTGKKLDDITLKNVLDGKVTPADVRISPETLELQAQVAESVGREAFAKNLRRASELIAVPDERILEIYNALRPYRSTKEELFEIANELESKYNAKINAAFIREAAEVYEQRNRLRED